MQFNSFGFLLAFLPAFLLLYFFSCKLNKKLGKVILIIFGLIFYSFSGYRAFFVLLISLLINYGMSIAIRSYELRKKQFLSIAIIINITILLFYKYANLFALSLFTEIASDSLLFNLAMPLGMSFFTFQQIMYVVNVYNGTISQTGISDYLAYILFFPKLIMGPLVEPSDLISQINDPALKKVNIDNIAIGLKLLSFGLFKKVVLADSFMRGVDWGFSSIEHASSLDIALVILFYTFEIYFDFSGYIDIATGISKMINIDLPQNFDSPYKAISIKDFWKRWHISLTRFFTTYIYYPLGGNRKGKIRTYVNIMIVFLISGIWHGSNWTFIIWGGIHGFLQVLERVFEKLINKIYKPIRWIFTFGFVNVLWLLFRSDSVCQWKNMLCVIFSFKSFYLSGGLVDSFILPEIPMLFRFLHITTSDGIYKQMSIFLFTIVGLIICFIPQNNYKTQKKLSPVNMIMAALAFAWSFLCLSSDSVFVYFNF